MKLFLALVFIIGGINCKPIADNQPRKKFAPVAVAETIHLLEQCIARSVDSQLIQTTAVLVQNVYKCLLARGYLSEKVIREKTAQKALDSLTKNMAIMQQMMSSPLTMIFDFPLGVEPPTDEEPKYSSND